MKIATVVTRPEGQVIHLPADIHLDGEEVLVKQVGQSIVLVPKGGNRWQPLLDSLDQFSADYLEDRAQPPIQNRETIFE